MSKSACPSDWMSNLPLVLLGIRTSTRDSSCVSPAHLLYGSPLRLPGEFFCPAPENQRISTSDFVLRLQRAIKDSVPAPAEFHSSSRGMRTAVPASLATCLGVFVRVDAVKRPLSPPYVGPYRVLQRSDKTFVLLKENGKAWTVSVDRLKPFFPPDMSASTPSTPLPASASLPPAASTPQPSPPAAPSAPSSSVPSSVPTSRFGRRLRPPDRYHP